MPQIGWFELLIIVVIAILVIGPKDFPLVLRKVGGWIGSIKRFFTEIQKIMNQIGLLWTPDLRPNGTRMQSSGSLFTGGCTLYLPGDQRGAMQSGTSMD